MLHQEIAGLDLIFVVLHEGPPGLPGTSAVLGSNHVFLHSACSVPDTELQSKFVGNPICTPAGFVDGHLTDQVLMLLWNSRSTGFPALFSPENLETRGMPTNSSELRPPDQRFVCERSLTTLELHRRRHTGTDAACVKARLMATSHLLRSNGVDANTRRVGEQ